MLSQKLKELRKKNGLTQEQLAEELNVSRQAVAKWESGVGMPDIENLKKISVLYHVSADSLLDNVIEKDLSLKNKFTFIEIALFALGVSFGIISQNFAFGFVTAFTMPGIVCCIEATVLAKKYQKEDDTLSQREVVARQIPKNFYGRILNTDSQSKKQRTKWYAIEAILFASLLTLFDIVGTVFGRNNILELEILGDANIDIILSCAIWFLCMFVVSFVLDYLRYEHVVKKYNRIGK